MSTVDEQVRELGRRWVDAELKGDHATLDSLAVDDFTMVGPLGFVLEKQQWLARYREGYFVTHSLTWDEISVREYGDTAVAIGIYEQDAEYRGNPSVGRYRCTQIAVRRNGEWLLAGMHLSTIAPPPGAPQQ